MGVVGSSLGGGLSWYSRDAGLQCSALTAVELVLADGTFVRATDNQDSDLLWAARGGGGGFGVVTALEFDLLPVPRVYAGMLAWDWKHAHRVLRAWGEWAGEAPETVTSIARLLRAPDEPWVPAERQGAPSRRHRRGRARGPGAVRAGPRSAPGAAPRGGHLRRRPGRLRRPAAPRSRRPRPRSTPTASFSRTCPIARSRRWSPPRVPARDRSCCSSSCASSGERCPGRRHEAVPWTAWTARSSSSAWAWTAGAGWAAVREDAHRVMSALQPWATTSAYLLMADEDVDERRGWPAASWQRLAALRAAADPHGLFVPPHSATR